MSDTPELAPGEVARSLRRLEDGLTALRSEIANLRFVHMDVYRADQLRAEEKLAAVRAEARNDRAEIRKDLDETRGNLTWLWRLIAGVVITAAITWVLVNYSGGPA